MLLYKKLLLMTCGTTLVNTNNSDTQPLSHHSYGDTDENSTARIQVTDRYIKLLFSTDQIVPDNCTFHMYLAHIFYPVYLAKYRMASLRYQTGCLDKRGNCMN